MPFVFELRDIWPESTKAVGAMGDSPAIRVLEKIELFLYRKAAHIVSVTESFKKTLVRRGIDGGKIDVVTNGVDISRFRPMAKDRELAAQLELKEDVCSGLQRGKTRTAHIFAAQKRRSPSFSAGVRS